MWTVTTGSVIINSSSQKAWQTPCFLYFIGWRYGNKKQEAFLWEMCVSNLRSLGEFKVIFFLGFSLCHLIFIGGEKQMILPYDLPTLRSHGKIDGSVPVSTLVKWWQIFHVGCGMGTRLILSGVSKTTHSWHHDPKGSRKQLKIMLHTRKQENLCLIEKRKSIPRWHRCWNCLRSDLHPDSAQTRLKTWEASPLWGANDRGPRQCPGMVQTRQGPQKRVHLGMRGGEERPTPMGDSRGP